VKKDTLNKIKEAKSNPVFDGLSDELKDPKQFTKIERKIIKTMLSDHTHKTMKQFIKCKRCQIKVQKKTDTIKELGFKDFNQYQNWKKVMGMIINKKNFTLYDKS
jgi:hypothetical protein